jgi:hypothetical protein
MFRSQLSIAADLAEVEHGLTAVGTLSKLRHIA